MQTLSTGVKKPEDNDRGAGASGFWDALELNCDFLDAALTIITQAVPGTGWVASGNFYRKVITMPTSPSALLFGQCKISAYLNVDKHEIFPTMERISATSFYLYMPNDTTAVDLTFTR